MANVHAHPADSYSNKVYFDSALPGGAIYVAEELLPTTFVGGDSSGLAPHPALRAFALEHYNWALYGEGVPKQRAQFYHQLHEKKQMYGELAERRGSAYYGPDAPVIAATLRPEGARPLGPARDN
jgi:hypothetical protein